MEFSNASGVSTTAAADAPGQRALEGNDGGHLPSLQQLSETRFAGQSIGHRCCESFPDIEVARSVIRAVIERCSFGTTTLTGLLVERMGESEADSRGKAVSGALGQRHLGAVVIGVQRIRDGVDIRVVRILAVERPGKLESRRIHWSRRSDRCRARSAWACCGNGCDLCRRETETIPRAYRRSIGEVQGQQLRRVIADISDIQ